MAANSNRIGYSPTASTRLVASFIGSGIAEDLAKTRLQVEGRRGRSIRDVLIQTYRAEGLGALWKGLVPALLRQMNYTSLSMSNQAQDVSFFTRLMAGGCAGGFAIFVFNWAEVIKVQIQASSTKMEIVDVIRNVYRTNGIIGFWSGVRPNIARTFIVNAAELGSYDQIKTQIFVPIFGNTLASHLGASGLAGVISASVSTPVDVVKTRWMNEAAMKTSADGQKPSGMVSRGLQILKNEGIGALYAGFGPICVRKVCWCAAFFCSYENLLPVVAQTTLDQSQIIPLAASSKATSTKVASTLS